MEEFGKPHKPHYKVAETLLGAIAAQTDAPALDTFSRPKRLYMIGDNPAADVRGANNAGDDWRSILVCTGVYQGGIEGNDHVDPAWRVEQDLHSAVDRLLLMDDKEHLT